MTEFVSRPPSYRSIQKRVRDRTPSLRESSWAVCGFRTEFFEKRHFFGSSFSFKNRVFEEDSPVVDWTSHPHASCILSQTLKAIPPSSLRSRTLSWLSGRRVVYRYWAGIAYSHGNIQCYCLLIASRNHVCRRMFAACKSRLNRQKQIGWNVFQTQFLLKSAFVPTKPRLTLRAWPWLGATTLTKSNLYLNLKTQSLRSKRLGKAGLPRWVLNVLASHDPANLRLHGQTLWWTNNIHTHIHTYAQIRWACMAAELFCL